MERASCVLGLILMAAIPIWSRADDPTLDGEWKTSLGIVTIKTEGEALIATFANPQIPGVKGTLKDRTAILTNRKGEKRGDASLTLDDSGRAFKGRYQAAHVPSTVLERLTARSRRDEGRQRAVRWSLADHQQAHGTGTGRRHHQRGVTRVKDRSSSKEPPRAVAWTISSETAGRCTPGRD